MIFRTLRQILPIALVTSTLASLPAAPASADWEYLGYNSAMAGVLHRNNMRHAYGGRSAQSASGASPRILESFDYSPGSVEAADARRAFIDGARRAYGDSASAELIVGLVNDGTLDAEYERIIGSYGLGDDNPIDAITAFAVLSWTIANRAKPPTQSEVAAVRNDMRFAVGPELTRLDESQRRSFGEATRHALISTQIAWVAAVQSDDPGGQIQKMSEDVNDKWIALFELNLRELVINEDGFEPA